MDDLIKAEEKDSNLMNEMQKSREQLAFHLKQQQLAYETEEIYNERLANLGETSLINADKESQEILGSYEKEEQRLTLDYESKTQEISALRFEMERLEQDYNQKKEKSDEISKILKDFEQKTSRKAEYEKSIREIDSGLKDYNVDMEITAENLAQSIQKQELLTSQIKRLNELRKVQTIKTQYDETQTMIQALKEETDLYKSKFYNGLQQSGIVLPKKEDNLDETSNIINKSLETLKKEIKKTDEKKAKIEEKLREINAFRSVNNKEFQDLDRKLKTLEKTFQKSGLSSFLKSNQEVLNFEARYKETKQELQNAEKALAIMQFTQNDLQTFLLGKSKEKSKCEFCEQPLSKQELDKLEWKIQELRQPKADKHQESLKEKIQMIRKEKEVLNKRKADYEEYSRLKRRAIDLQQSVGDQEQEKQDLLKELEGAEAWLLKERNKLEKYEELLDIYNKLEGLEIEIETQTKSLKKIEKEHPGLQELNLSNEEKEMLGSSKVFEALEETMIEVKKQEKRKSVLENEFQMYRGQKEKMLEFLSRLSGDEERIKGLECEKEKINEITQGIREDLPKKIARVKKLDNEKKTLDEQIVCFFIF